MEKSQMIGIELEKLSNEELEALVLDINKDQLKGIGQLAFFQGFRNTIHFNEYLKVHGESITEFEKENTQIVEIHNKIINSFNNIESIVQIDNKGQLGVEYFKALRKEAFKLLKSISIYITEVSYGNEITSELTYRNNIKESIGKTDPNIDLNRFYDSVSSFLMEDTSLLKNKVMDIIGSIPFRLPKKNYYDLLKKNLLKSLSNNTKRQVDYILKRYRAIFNGAFEEEYGHKFERFFRMSQESKLFDYLNRPFEEVTELQKETSEALMVMQKIVIIIRECGVILNKLIVISMLREYLTDEVYNHRFTDVMAIWQEYIANNEDLGEEIVNKCNKEIMEIEKGFAQNNLTLQKISIETLKRKNAISDSTNKELLKTQSALAYLNDLTLEKEDLIIHEIQDRVDYDYLEQSIDNFIQFIDRSIRSMSNIQRKARMRRILSLTDFPFETPEGFFRYLKNSIELSSSHEEALFIIDSIGIIMEKYKKRK